MNAAAMASMAGTLCSVGGSRQATNFRENRARNLRARGSVSEVSVLRKAATVACETSAILMCFLEAILFENGK